MFLSLLLLRKIQTSGASVIPWEEWGVLGPRELIGSAWVITDSHLLLVLLISLWHLSFL